MTLVIHELERVERRVLGALRCIDATTGATIEQDLEVGLATPDGEAARLLRNRSGLYVITLAPGLEAHAAAFAQPPADAPRAYVATVRDPAGRYLPRRAGLGLPRDPDPAHADQAGSLFRPVEVPLYPSGSAPAGANWAVLRISLVEAGGDRLGGALLRVVRNGTVLARGLTDWRGEGMLPVAGVPVTTWSDDPNLVVVNTLDVQVEAVFDPAAGRRVRAAEVAADHPPATPPMVDPDAIEAARASLPQTAQAVTIAARREQTLSLVLALP
ncbi:MAG TPA: hypothetical protein PKH69_02970 [Thiobacillaceae bacterium]|nr:hypothetical protein [Thiobacillaceae bacterium]HNU63049.1 hypothetical protein [Thiobacillaceae bacterium]